MPFLLDPTHEGHPPHRNECSAESKDRGLRAFVMVAAARGVCADVSTLSHKLSLDGHILKSQDIIRAANLVGLRARVLRRPQAKRLASIPLPAMTEMKHDGWAVLDFDKKSNKFIIEHGGHIYISAENLVKELCGDIVVFAYQARTSGEVRMTGRSWFFRPLKRYLYPLWHALFASLFIQLFSLLTPLIFQLVIDKVLVQRSKSTLVVLAAAMLVLSLFGSLLKYLRSFALNHTSSRIDVELGSSLVAHLFSLPISFFDSRATGSIIARIRELETIRSFLTGPGLTSIIDLLFIIASMCILSLYSFDLSLIIFVSLPLYIFVAVLYGPILQKQLEEKFRKWSLSQDLFVENIFGIQTIKAAAIEPCLEAQWEERFAKYVKSAFNVSMTSAQGQGIVEFITKISNTAVIYFGAEFVINGELSVGALIAFSMIANQVTQPILRVAQLWQNIQQVIISVDRIGEILVVPPEEEGQPFIPRNFLQGCIDLGDVSFRYKPDSPFVLRNISFTISPGEIIGIVGSSGSGKSTLAKLLQRFYTPSSGVISIDGVDISQVDIAWLRSQIGVVLQDNVLFSRSVHENIAIGRPSLSRAEVIRLARLAGADEFIRQLPSGYNTLIEERGTNLSGGQRQRLAIARALAGNPRILIFDEATSSLDYESEQIIQRNMSQIATGRTVIIIAHRLAAVRQCDRIIGMANGQVMEIGTHASLVDLVGGVYSSLWSLQVTP